MITTDDRLRQNLMYILERTGRVFVGELSASFPEREKAICEEAGMSKLGHYYHPGKTTIDWMLAQKQKTKQNQETE